MRRLGFAVFLFSLVLATIAVPVQAAEGAKPSVFTAKSDEGQVWVSVNLARFRTGEAYLPLVVAVANRAKGSIELDRKSIRLVDSAGRVFPMPSVGQLREAYNKRNLDQTMVRVFGFPTGTVLTLSRLVPSNFFPPLTGRGGTAIDRVELAPFTWTLDLMYFPRPKGPLTGLTLEVAPKGWQQPIRLSVKL